MIEYRTELKKILQLVDFSKLEDQVNTVAKLSSEKELAIFFVDCVYLKSVVQLIIDDHWIQNKNTHSDIHFDRFIKKFLEAELKPVLFLHSFFQEAQITDMPVAAKALVQTEELLIKFIKSKPYPFQKTFLQSALIKMSELFELEHQLSANRTEDEGEAKLSLYRTFDVIDRIFELDYILNEVPEIDQKERLYEGAGLGVQSSYATTVLALQYLNLPKGSKFIDLGSGYGRIGLVLGLMRPDIQFTGYEYVAERVEIANKARTHLTLDQHVRFIAQDLVSTDFKIPVADTYYIFDAFTDASYSIIMPQIEEMTLHKRITVVTKGNARKWMKSQFWSAPQEFSGGNLCVFRSSSRPR